MICKMTKDKNMIKTELPELTSKNIERCPSYQRCVKKEFDKSLECCMHLCAFLGNEMYTPFLLCVHAGALYIMGCLHHWCCKRTIISVTIAVSFSKLHVSLVSLVVELKP